MGTKISALPSASSITGSEIVPIVQGGNTVKTTTSALKTTNASDLTTGTVDVSLLPVATTSSAGVGLIGASAGMLCDGADSRLSDSRIPTGSAGGKLTGTYPNPTLAASGVVAGTYGSSTSVPVVVIAEDGTVTSASNIPISGSAGGTVTSVGLSSSDLDVSGSPIIDAGTIQANLKTVTTAETIGTWNQVPVLTVSAKGLITGKTTSTIPVGIANGVAGLDSGGKVPAGQLPSFVDDVIEVANFAALPATGVAGVIYVTLDTNLTYRWGGSVYVQIDAGPTPSSTTPLVEANSGAVGTSLAYARADHVHPASGGLSTNVQVFTSGGTWTKPSGAKSVRVELLGGGGGGGAGIKITIGSGTGGSGGGGGGIWDGTIDATQLPSTVTISVGAAGVGGTYLAAATSGGATSFGSFANVTGGSAGVNASASATISGGSAGAYTGNAGGQAFIGAAGAAGGQAARGGAGGGGGGGISNFTTCFAGGLGGAGGATSISGGSAGSAGALGGANGGAGGAGTSSSIYAFSISSGGGGGGAGQNGGNGGNAGGYGCGGGGAGASGLTLSNASAGGNGSGGLAIITTYF